MGKRYQKSQGLKFLLTMKTQEKKTIKGIFIRGAKKVKRYIVNKRQG